MATESAEIWSASFGFCPIETTPEIFSALMPVQGISSKRTDFCPTRPQRMAAFSEITVRDLSRSENGGKGIRTPDIQLAKLALYQLSYAPAANADCRLRNAECKLAGSLVFSLSGQKSSATNGIAAHNDGLD